MNVDQATRMDAAKRLREAGVAEVNVPLVDVVALLLQMKSMAQSPDHASAYVTAIDQMMLAVDPLAWIGD